MIEQMPVTDLPLDEDPVGQLFGKNKIDAPANTQTPNAAHPSLPARAGSSPISAEIPPRRAPAPPVAAAVPKPAGEPAPKHTMLGHAAPPAAAFGAPDAPPPRAAAVKRAQMPAGALTAGVQTQARAESGTIPRASLGPEAPARSSAQAPAELPQAVPVQGTRTLEFDGSIEPSGLELAAPTPAQERAQSLLPKSGVSRARSAKPEAAPKRSSPIPVAAQQERSQRAEDSEDHPAPAAAAAQQVHGSDRPSLRPRHVKRTDARRAARRAAAKHLPPAPPPTLRRWDPARITLAAFAVVLAAGALALGAVSQGFITLPPAAAAMLGIRPADDARPSAKPAPPPNLVMPSAPRAAPPPAAKRVPEPLAVEPAAAPAPAEPQAEPRAESQPSTAVAEPQVAAEPQPSAAVAEPPAAIEPQAEPQPPTAEIEAAPEPQAAAEPTPAAAAEPVDPAKVVALARARLASDPPGAAEMMMRAIAKNTDDHHAMEVLVRAWIAMGRGKDAVGYAEFIVKKRPKRGVYRLLEGDAKTQAGDLAGAAAAYRALLQLEPDNRDAKRRLGLE